MDLRFVMFSKAFVIALKLLLDCDMCIRPEAGLNADYLSVKNMRCYFRAIQVKSGLTRNFVWMKIWLAKVKFLFYI